MPSLTKGSHFNNVKIRIQTLHSKIHHIRQPCILQLATHAKKPTICQTWTNVRIVRGLPAGLRPSDAR